MNGIIFCRAEVAPRTLGGGKVDDRGRSQQIDTRLRRRAALVQMFDEAADGLEPVFEATLKRLNPFDSQGSPMLVFRAFLFYPGELWVKIYSLLRCLHNPQLLTPRAHHFGRDVEQLRCLLRT
jgi:hypothetical protein